MTPHQTGLHLHNGFIHSTCATQSIKIKTT